MLNIFYDRIIDGERIPNGIKEEWLKYYTPQFNPQWFRKDTRFEPAVYPSDLYQGGNANICSVDDIETKFKDVEGCVGIYPIEGFGSPDRSIGNDARWNKKFRTAFDYMGGKATEYVKSGKLRLYYGFLQEAFIKDSEIINLHFQLKKYDITNAIVAVNDYLAYDRYSKWCEKHNKIKRFSVVVFSHSLFEKSHEINCILNGKESGVFNLSKPYKEHKHSAMTIEDFTSTKDVKRKSNFLCLNRRMRPHRLATLCVMNKHDLIKNNEVSFQFTIDDCPYYVENVLDEERKLKYEKDFHEVKSMEYQWVDYPIAMEAKDGIHHGYGWENCKPYMDSYFSIVTETDFTNPTGYVSEKLWKPISFFQPFILVGNPGSLKFIKEFGFKTFSPLIDESYDEETNAMHRFAMIESEMVRLGKMSKEDIHTWYWHMEDIYTHNYNLFMDYAKNYNNFNKEFLSVLKDTNKSFTFIPEFRRKK